MSSRPWLCSHQARMVLAVCFFQLSPVNHPFVLTQCHVCNGSCRKTFLPIIYSGAIKFMKSTRLTSTLPLVMDHDNSNNIINTLWEDKDWCKNVFGTKSPSKANVVGFFLQLIATRIISFELVKNRGLKCVITLQSNGKHRYDDTSVWLGIKFCSPKKGGGKIHLAELITAQQKAADLLLNY